MHKSHYSILFLLAILLAAGCEMENPMFQQPELRLKSSTKWRIDVVSDQKLEIVRFNSYDINGNLTLNEEYNESGDLILRIEFDYLQSSRIENITSYHEGVVIKQDKYAYHFNVNGQVVERVMTKENGDTSGIIKYKYDDHGNVVEEMKFDSSGKLMGSISFIYIYNGDGFVTGSLINDDLSDGFRTRDSIIYKPNENTVEQIRFGTSGEKEIIYTYIYDKHGLIYKEYHSTQKGEILRKYLYEYTYY